MFVKSLNGKDYYNLNQAKHIEIDNKDPNDIMVKITYQAGNSDETVYITIDFDELKRIDKELTK